MNRFVLVLLRGAAVAVTGTRAARVPGARFCDVCGYRHESVRRTPAERGCYCNAARVAMQPQKQAYEVLHPWLGKSGDAYPRETRQEASPAALWREPAIGRPARHGAH